MVRGLRCSTSQLPPRGLTVVERSHVVMLADLLRVTANGTTGRQAQNLPNLNRIKRPSYQVKPTDHRKERCAT